MTQSDTLGTLEAALTPFGLAVASVLVVCKPFDFRPVKNPGTRLRGTRSIWHADE
ncbi:MAG: hypothetical protein ACRDYE_03220 [Acidimicrobiales bacterium]